MDNSIGNFEIGESQIGVAQQFNVSITIISQYANSPILYQLIENFASYVDQAGNIDNFFDMMFNIDSAQGVGLDIIGRIVGISRVLAIPTGSFFGFEEASVTNAGFGQQSFFAGQPLTSNYALADSAYRLLLQAQAFANICNNSVPAINQLLLLLFSGRGVCYVADGLNNTLTYTFNFVLSAVEIAIVTNSGVLPRPSGSSISISHL